MINDKTVYIHTPNVHHNDKSPEEIVPVLINLFHPESVIDVGCGVANFLREFKKHGVEDTLGIDGGWDDLNEIDKNIGRDNFVIHNLNEVFLPKRKFDLGICLEVAEHIDQKYAENLIETITNSSDNIVFSAAIPLQGGQNHINEQWNDYWVDKFGERGYQKMDFLRPYFWNNKNVFWWYKQNILFFTKRPELYKEQNYNYLDNPIHPELFELKTNELEILRVFKDKYDRILDSQYNWRFYLKRLILSIKKRMF